MRIQRLLLLVAITLRCSSAFLSSQIVPRTAKNGLGIVHVFPGLNNEKASKPEEGIPFIIDRISETASDRVYQEVAEMCIEVFFNADGSTPPWKSLQLGYLRGLQSADLRRRRSSKPPNEMFVARRVVPLESPLALQNTPLILDVKSINNLSGPDPSQDYVRGEVLGFCEVSERPYSLGETEDAGKGRGSTLRPILTNLSVKDDTRKSGIGSKLVDACEDAVLEWEGGHDEIILEVEDDNQKALEFYARRGYQQLFADPACRRFNTGGFLLTKERCTKICMKKNLSVKRTLSLSAGETIVGEKKDFSNLIQSLKESVFG